MVMGGQGHTHQRELRVYGFPDVEYSVQMSLRSATIFGMTFHELREGATGLRAIEALRYVAAEAGNLGGQAVGRTTEQLHERYLDWTDEAERLLGNVFPEDVVSDLIHTSNYWAFRAASGASPRLTPLILREAESRRRALSELLAELQAEQYRWQHPPGGATLAVPDTNMFLQAGAPFQDIDWPTALESQSNVRIVIPLVVIHELDRLKRQGNQTTSTLARTSLRWLERNLPMRPSARSAKLTAGFPETTMEAYVQDLPTRPEDADGLIIRFTRQLGRISELPTKLVTRDLGMRLRAAGLGVDAVQLPD
jgi:hypothetical protein